MKKFTPFNEFEKDRDKSGKPLGTSMQESCNERLKPDGPEACSAPCPPYWQPTCNIRCLENGLVDKEEADGCGNTRWVRSTDKVIWADEALTDCDDPKDAGEYIYMLQRNQCGDTRRINTGNRCCLPEWVNVPGDPICYQGMLYVDQVDGCGGSRQQPLNKPVSWTNTGSTRCLDGNYEREQANECGELRWVSAGALTWSDTGQTRCTGSLIEKEQQNQCGAVRWVVTDATLVWEDTGNMTCDGMHQVEQQDQCGNIRWENRGPIVWTNTGVTQCGPVSANIENQQVNQCGTLRWLDTGISCSIADPVLPGSFGGGCYVDRPTSSQSYFRLAFGNNGTGTRSTMIGSGTAPFSWAPGVVDGSNYEIMVDFSFAGSMAANYTGPANGVWVSLASTVEMKWAINGHR